MKHFSVIDLTERDSLRRIQRAGAAGHKPRWYNGAVLRFGGKLYVWTRAGQ